MMRWNREAAMLGIPDLPEEGFKHVGDRKIKPQGGSGGGGGGHTTSTGTQYTSSVPKWLESEQKDLVARGAALAQTPYQAYSGERISQFTPMQRQAFGAAETQQVAPQLGMATGLTGINALQSFRAPGTAGSFMNPFLEQALAPQLASAARQSAIQGTQQQADATQRGAFGGSRDAIMRAERERNLLGQQADIVGRGFSQAFDTAQDQFNRERAAQLQAAGQLGQLGQQQFGQEMDIMGRQREFGDAQQQQIQRILDQQYADFREQRDYPYQQLGFMSDLIQGRGGSTRSVYTQPTASPLQTAAGLGTIASAFMAKGGEVQRYADGGITRLLGDDQLQQVQSPMAQMAAQEEMMQRQAIRDQAPASMPRETDMTEAELLAAMQRALQEGDRAKAAVIQEIIEERRIEDSGIAMIAPDSVGDMPEGGVAGMAGGGMVSFDVGGGIRSPYEMTEQEFQRRLMEEQAMGAGRGDVAGPTAQEMAAAHRANPRMMQGLPALQEEPAGNVSTEAGLGALGVGDVMGLMGEAGFDPQANMARQEQLALERQQAAQERVAANRMALDEMIQSRGVYAEDRETALKDELESMTGKKENAKSMALFQAGLAILSADPSRGAFAAIGEGALKGLGEYKGDLEKLEARRDKVNERIDRIIDIRRQERTADDRDRLALEKEENALKEEAAKEMQSLYKDFNASNERVATTVVNSVINSREKALDRQFREENLRNRSVADLAQMRISLDQTIRRLETKTFLEPEEEIELRNARADRDEIMKRLAGRQGIELPSQRPVGGGTLSQADQDLINRYMQP